MLLFMCFQSSCLPFSLEFYTKINQWIPNLDITFLKSDHTYNSAFVTG